MRRPCNSTSLQNIRKQILVSSSRRSTVRRNPRGQKEKNGAIEKEPGRQRPERPAADAEKVHWLRPTLPAEASGLDYIPFLVEFDDHFKL